MTRRKKSSAKAKYGVNWEYQGKDWDHLIEKKGYDAFSKRKVYKNKLEKKYQRQSKGMGTIKQARMLV